MMDIRFLTTDEIIEIQRSTLPNSGEPNMDRLEGALFRIQTLHEYDGCDDVFPCWNVPCCYSKSTCFQ